ncbi:MAG: drug/metabolite exporter YedA [Actinobacteria bacterium]|nr:drug/metabolite exporter YedA [Actinomycetota bacterium]
MDGVGTNGRSKLLVLLSLISVYFIWGSTYLALRFGLEGFPPFLLNGLRFILAGALIYPLSRLGGRARPSRHQIWNAFRMGMFLLVGGVGGMALALEAGIGSGLAATAAGVIPVWSALAAGAFGQWPQRREWVGLALGLAGVVVLVQEGDFRASTIGLVLAVAAPLAWSIGSVWGSSRDMPGGLMSAAIQLAGAGLVMLVIGLALGERIVSVPGVKATLSLAYLVLFGSVVAFTAYVYLLNAVRSSLATSYAYVNPVVAIVLGLTLGDEIVTGPVLIALPLILAAVALVAAEGKMRKQAPIADHDLADSLVDAGV